MNLHELPSGSVVAAPGTTLVAYLADRFGHWYLADARHGPYSVGDLLAMAQGWIVLRNGLTVPGAGTPEAPEVRHYIGVTDLGRLQMGITCREPDGRIRGSRHPWEPLTDEGGLTYYRVSEPVAREFMSDDEDEDDAVQDLDQL